jgi:hypothetical protein
MATRRSAAPEPLEVPSHDDRPNSGLREGAVDHAQVNEAIRMAPKTVIFGQQSRLRLGLLTQDEQLPRYHAGHDLVKFFYGGVRQLPEYLLDAILAAGISVTLVKANDLLVFDNARQHQSFHVGRTRKTIYMPEHIVQAAFNRGYDYWALSEVIIQETWPLLDYLLLLELVRRFQVRLHEVHLPGYYFIKDTLRQLNKHRKDPLPELEREGRTLADPKDDEFTMLYRQYAPALLEWDRSIIDQDPYDVADQVYNEDLERQWAQWKVDAIVHTFEFPTYFQLDRDIVHGAAYRLAEAYGQPAAPQTAAEAIHDLVDVARFRVGRQIRTEPLLDQLIDFGAPGISGFADAAASELATGRQAITDNYFDGYDTVARFRIKLEALHSDNHPDLGAAALAYDSLQAERLVLKTQEALQHFRQLPSADQEESRLYLHDLLLQLLGSRRPDLGEVEKVQMLQTPEHFSPTRQVAGWLELAAQLVPEDDSRESSADVVQVLRQLQRHAQYHTLFLDQARELSRNHGLTFGPPHRLIVAGLRKLVPARAYRLSSDPPGVHARLKQLAELSRQEPDNVEQYALLTAVLLRLDQSPQYGELLARVRQLGRLAEPALQELLDSDNPHDQLPSLRDNARELLVSIARTARRRQPAADAGPGAGTDSATGIF